MADARHGTAPEPLPATAAGAAKARRVAWTALLSCVATQAAFDLSQVALRGDLDAPGYPLLVGALTAAVLVPIAMGSAWLPRPAASALALWVFAEFFCRWPSIGVGLPLATVLAAVTFVLLSRAGPPPWAAGVGVGACLCLGFTTAERLFAWLPGDLAELPDWVSVGAVTLVSGAALAWNGRARLLYAPVGVLAPPLALAAVLGSVALDHPTPDRSAFRRGPDGAAVGRPNLMVLVLDTLRADHLSLYGYERDTTPELTRWAARRHAAVFPSVYSPSSWTVPAHLSLLTGTLPSEHQGHCGNHAHVRRLRLEVPVTLAEKLGEAGYRSAGVIANPNAMTVDGMERGFDLWAPVPPPHRLSFLGEALRQRLLPLHHRSVEIPLATADRVNHELVSLLDSCDGGGCWLFANYVDVHAPYWPSAPFAGRFGAGETPDVPATLSAAVAPEVARSSRDAYDEEILGLDHALGELLTALEARRYFDNGWLFVTSDHGEAFLEHASVHHASNLYDEQIRVPLLVFYPDGTYLPARRDPVGLLDVTATVSAIATGAGLGPGRDLRDPEAPERPVQAEFFGCRHPSFSWGPYTGEPSRAVIRGDRKLLERDGRRELYALDIDPHERRSRTALEPDVAASLATELPPLERRSDRVRDEGAPFDPRITDALRALGYLE